MGGGSGGCEGLCLARSRCWSLVNLVKELPPRVVRTGMVSEEEVLVACSGGGGGGGMGWRGAWPIL